MQPFILPNCFHKIEYIFILFLSLFLSDIVKGQTSFFTPSPYDSLSMINKITEVNNRYKNEVATLQGENKKYIAETYQKRLDNLKDIFQSKQLFTNEQTNKYISSLANLIIKNNPGLSSIPIDVYLSKSGVFNAVSVGEGVIVLYGGLFSKLENESQLVFILCHEISHVYLNHSNKSVYRYVNTLYSKETQTELKRIKNADYQKRERIEKLVKGMSFNSTRHSRDHEGEADSLAIELMHNTKFDVSESLTCLGMLDSIDNEPVNINQLLLHTFNSPEYPFKKSWTDKEEGLLGGHAVLETDKQLEDSLKTHPECKNRILVLSNKVTTYTNTTRQKNFYSKVTFSLLKNRMPYETINYYYQTEQYSQCLMHCLEILATKPDDAYAVALTGKVLNGIYKAQKNHILSKVVNYPSPDYPPQYNDLLQFLQNIHLNELGAINYFFLKQYEQKLANYKEFTDAFNTSRVNNKN